MKRLLYLSLVIVLVTIIALLMAAPAWAPKINEYNVG